MRSGNGEVSALSETDISTIFKVRSRFVIVAYAAFLAVCLAVVITAGIDLESSATTFVGAVVSCLLFVGAGTLVLFVRGDPFPAWATAAVAAATVGGTALSYFTMPVPTDPQLTGIPSGAPLIALAFLAVRGRVLMAWLINIAATAVMAVWFGVTDQDPMTAIWLMAPGFAILIMGSLFSYMLRPMARRIAELRARSRRQAADDAAAEAAAKVRAARLSLLEERTRPLLRRIAERDHFDEDDVATARLVEARLRDGIRAPGLDTPLIRDAVWRARERGADVLLLDDGALDDLDAAQAEAARRRLLALLAARIDTLDAQDSLTARLLPPDREVLATVVVLDAVEGSERLRREYCREDLLPGGGVAS